MSEVPGKVALGGRSRVSRKLFRVLDLFTGTRAKVLLFDSRREGRMLNLPEGYPVRDVRAMCAVLASFRNERACRAEFVV